MCWLLELLLDYFFWWFVDKKLKTIILLGVWQGGRENSERVAKHRPFCLSREIYQHWLYYPDISKIRIQLLFYISKAFTY